MKSFPQPDGRVRLELVPELHHGQPRQRWIGEQGVLRLDASRPKRTFDDLALSAELAPGAMLVLSSLPNRPGSLGHHFFTEKGKAAWSRSCSSSGFRRRSTTGCSARRNR